MPPAAPSAQQTTLEVSHIKQHPGLQTVTCRVKVKVPDKFFPQLQPAEQNADYEGEAVEFREWYKFVRHAMGWGAVHEGPGLRFVGMSA